MAFHFVTCRSGLFAAAAAYFTGSCLVAAPAEARDYTLHMLAHVPTRCTIHSTRHAIVPVVIREADDAAVALAGDPGVRISCNVPYAMYVHRTARRANVWLDPVAMRPAAPALGLAVTLPGAEGPLRGHCSADDLAESGGGCTPMPADRGPWRGAPAGLARFALVAATDTVSDVPVEPAVDATVVTRLAGHPGTDGPSSAAKAGPLMVTLTPRY